MTNTHHVADDPMRTEPKGIRPHVVCHMAASLDGRIVVGGWPADEASAVRREYDIVHASYGADAWMCGRITMEAFAGAVRSDVDVAFEYEGQLQREDFLAPGEHRAFAFAVDPRGRLAWNESAIDGDHVVAVLTHRVSDAYLSFLRARGVSYLLAGSRDVDLPHALEKIASQFGVRTLMLEGGGSINGSMLRAGLVDEVSLLLAPVIDARLGTAAVFDSRDGVPSRLELISVERRADEILWIRYRTTLLS